MKPGYLRIIAGQWRSQRIPIPDAPGLRPTTDRTRETLFNWLAPHIVQANCLDICSGSGIFGFEALSRGAAHVTLVDKSSRVTKHLQEQKQKFKTEKAEIICADVVQWLSQPATQQYDIAFIDPPFTDHLLQSICQPLAENEWLKPQALIYLEMALTESLSLPKEWEQLKEQKAGKVRYELWRKN